MSLIVPLRVQHKEKPELQGIVVSEHLVPQVFTNENNEQIIKQQPLLGVCWDGNPCPAIDYLSPFDLVLLGTSVEVDEDDDDEDYDDEDDDLEDEDEEETLAAPVS